MTKYELEKEMPPVGRLVQEVTFGVESPGTNSMRRNTRTVFPAI
jgi:hypothetical protein